MEGMRNEHIVATSIFCYDIQNVTESRIHFQQEALIQEGIKYDQGRHKPLCAVFGTQSMPDDPAVQEIGSLRTLQGRMIAFPNTFQHKIDPFSLVHKTKPYYRRFMILWLVDPHYRIASTANVPPQQLEWAENGCRDNKVRQCFISLEEANEYR